MNIPAEIKIGGFIIKVKEVKNLSVERESTGEYHPFLQEIWLDDTLTKQQREEVFVHEVLEAVKDIYDIVLAHKELTLIATVLHQILKDNNIS